MPILKPTFRALLKEAEFTKEMLGSGATQIQNAHYASKGVYFQSFVSLSTGLERIGKLCLTLDHYIENNGEFPDFNYLKNEIGHKLALLYERSQGIIARRSLNLTYLQTLSDPVHQSILNILHSFAEGNRYSNINFLVGSRQAGDPIAAWFVEVDLPLYQTRVTDTKKTKIARNAQVLADMMNSYATVLHSSETGTEITDFKEASYRTGVFEAVAPYRQLYVLQVIRYWVDLLSKLETPARELGRQEIPYFGEVFAFFYNENSLLRSKRTW